MSAEACRFSLRGLQLRSRLKNSTYMYISFPLFLAGLVPLQKQKHTAESFTSGYQIVSSLLTIRANVSLAFTLSRYR